MPKGPFTVLDGLEGVWEPYERELREEGERRFHEIAGKAKRAARRVAESRPVRVADALFGNDTEGPPQNGPVDHGEVDRRMRRTQSDLQLARETAKLSGSPTAALAAWPAAATLWLNRIRPDGAWDDKRKKGRELERQGNFSFGATAAALGMPRTVALLGAGVMQRKQAVDDALRGEKIRERSGSPLAPPYGDDPKDQRSIRDGYAYGRGRLTNSGRR
jgi:hypothetical protein